jgi:metal-sulfur cluster biosynthetic enzyme
MQNKITKADVIEKLKEVIDPELSYDIVTLGLLRDIEFGDWQEDFGVYDYIKIIMTLTSPMCPFADALIEDVETKVMELNAGEPQVEITFDPPWQAPESLREELGV